MQDVARAGRGRASSSRVASAPVSPTSPESLRRARGVDDDLRLAHVVVDAVDALTTERFGAQDLAVEAKPDLTPVTDADRRAEDLVRAQLARARPRDAVLGEERGSTGSGARQWVVDPIDGTKNFVRGVPVWATLLALLVDGEPVVGVVSAPALGRRWWAGTGTGAWTGRSLSSARALHVSGVDDLADASLSYSSLTGWEERDLLDPLLDLTRSVWRTRAYGDFWSHVLVAEGAVDVACEPELELYDMAALVPVVTEAGGRFTSLAGEDGPHGGSAVVTNGLLHERVLEALAPRS
ncbi:histidinol-phosphatase [Pseudokineococcus sp. 1T1Z-3]|uniref:histidinol-phosphatase n=1 Tax=Pseudokineococcus sp. 1T1Z-3 TaxID=3132745 RepID=UPI00403F7BFF